MKNLFLSLCAVLSLCPAVYAFGPPSENGFSFSFGPGGGYSPDYTGSRESKIEILPYIDISYTRDWIKTFASVGDGAGVKVFGRGTGLFASCGIDFGESRKRSDNYRLEGTASINNLFKYFIKTGIETEPIDFVICANYFRVEAEYAQKDRNRKYHAMLFSPRAISGYPVMENLIFQIEVGVFLMNPDYAEIYHGVQYTTRYYPRYDAKPGLHDAYGELTIVFMPVDSVSIIAQGKYSRLLGDAARSPLTERRNIFDAKLFAAYSLFP